MQRMCVISWRFALSCMVVYWCRSIEEKIYQRQLQKEGLSRVVIDDNAAAEARTFSRCETLEILNVAGVARAWLLEDALNTGTA